MTTILFPGIPKLDGPENAFQIEYEFALENGFQVILFDYEYFRQSGILKMNNYVHLGINTSCIYRGWMLKPDVYESLYVQAKQKGVFLINSPCQYEQMHSFKKAYALVQEDTAKTVFFDLKDLTRISVQHLHDELGNFLIKDYVKSAKNTEFPVFFDTSYSDEEFQQWLKKFIAIRGKSFNSGFCAKTYLPLKRYGTHTNEYRVYYLKKNILTISANSNQQAYLPKPPQTLLEKYIGLPSNFYTVDYAELENGQFCIIETGDGGVSGLSPDQDVNLFYRILERYDYISKEPEEILELE